MATLFSPFSIKGVTLRNRLAVSPMCQYSSENGFANNWHLVHLGSRAVGGAGMVIVEATGVSPEARISPQDLGIWEDAHIDKLREITTFMKANGAVPAIQLAHAGRKASTKVPWKGRDMVKPQDGGWQTVAPSAIPYSDNYPIPVALDLDGINKVVEDFRRAAFRAIQAGFDIIEIHASHGYLIHQFLSPLTNHRTDDYGGSFLQRSRLLLDVIAAVKEVIPESAPVLVRIPGTDWADGGFNPDDAVELAKLLKAAGIDLLDVTSGGLVAHQQISVGPAYQLPFATKIKKEVDILVSTVGMITDAEQAEAILVKGEADLIMMARELLRNPYFPMHAAHTLGAEIPWPVQYERAKPH
ncbi:MAG: NADH:flavin oxidoreductase/NADH oxidase [Chitinophagaceae bacterium]